MSHHFRIQCYLVSFINIHISGVTWMDIFDELLWDPIQEAKNSGNVLLGIVSIVMMFKLRCEYYWRTRC